MLSANIFKWHDMPVACVPQAISLRHLQSALLGGNLQLPVASLRVYTQQELGVQRLRIPGELNGTGEYLAALCVHTTRYAYARTQIRI